MKEKDILQSSLLKFENSVKPLKSNVEIHSSSRPDEPKSGSFTHVNSLAFDDRQTNSLFNQVNQNKSTNQPSSLIQSVVKPNDQNSPLTSFKSKTTPIPMSSPVKICVIGVGGAGNNVVNEMMGCQKDFDSSVVNMYALNTDLQHFSTLKNLSEKQLVLINSAKTKGKGSGGDPSIGEGATKDFEAGIRNLLIGSDLCIIIAGLGKGTGTGGGPIVAQIAKKMGCATIAILITPSHDDGDEQFRKTRISIQNFTAICDAISMISNDTVINKDNISVFEARSMINRTICTTIGSIVDTILTPSCQNIDFSDLKSFIKRGENVNQLLHLQLDLFDNDSDKIKAKLQNCLEHNLYSTSIEKMAKLLIQFNIGKNCDSNVLRNVISEIKALAKNEEISITTGIRLVERNEQKSIDIFLVKPDLATSTGNFQQSRRWATSNSFNSSVTLSSSSDDATIDPSQFSGNLRQTSNQLLETTKTENDFDTDKMSATINTMLVNNNKRKNPPDFFDEELFASNKTKIKN